MELHLQITPPHQLACYTMTEDGTDGCHVCFVVWEVVAGDNAIWLDGAIVCIGTVFVSDHKNRSMRRLFITIVGMHMQGL